MQKTLVRSNGERKDFGLELQAEGENQRQQSVLAHDVHRSQYATTRDSIAQFRANLALCFENCGHGRLSPNKLGEERMKGSREYLRAPYRREKPHSCRCPSSVEHGLSTPSSRRCPTKSVAEVRT